MASHYLPIILFFLFFFLVKYTDDYWISDIISCPSLCSWEQSGLIAIVRPRRCILRRKTSSSPEIRLPALCRLSVAAEWLCLYLFHASLCACWLPWCTALSQCFHLKGGCVFPQKTQLLSVSALWNPGQKETASFSRFCLWCRPVLVLCFWDIWFPVCWRKKKR